jgi:hypothetical protein
VLGWLAEARGSGLTNAAKLVVPVTSVAAVIGLRIATVLVLVLYRRFRHLVVFLATLAVTDWVVARVLFVELPRPGVPVLGGPGVVRVPLQGDLGPWPSRCSR